MLAADTLKQSPMDRFDPRARLICGAVLALAPLPLTGWAPLSALVLAGAVLAIVATPNFAGLLRRLAAVNVFMLILVAMLPWSVPGDALWTFGAWSYSEAGLAEALRIALRANAVMLWLTAFWASMDPVTFAHALQRLGAPARLTQLFFLTARYLDVFEREYETLRDAMRIRAFRPRLNRHTLRSLGYLVGMLVLRAWNRSDRILDAMRCRGFNGRFHTHRHLRAKGLDYAMPVAAVVVAALLWVWDAA